MKENISRKEFLQQCALMGAVVVGGGSLLAGCGGGGDKADSGSASQSAGTTSSAADPCGDLSGLTDADKQMRTTLKYVAVSTDANKNCLNCKFYQADQHGEACGGCQLFKGPVAPKGNCSSWFAQDQG